MQIRQTIAAPAFDKFYLEGPWTASGIHPDLHHMKAPDLGLPHCHPWSFRSLIIRGSYVEEVYAPDGSTTLVTHNQGDSFVIAAEHIHRIVELPEGEAWTFIVPEGPVGRTWGYWRWKDGQAFKKDHNGRRWRPVAAE